MYFSRRSRTLNAMGRIRNRMGECPGYRRIGGNIDEIQGRTILVVFFRVEVTDPETAFALIDGLDGFFPAQ